MGKVRRKQDWAELDIVRLILSWLDLCGQFKVYCLW